MLALLLFFAPGKPRKPIWVPPPPVAPFTHGALPKAKVVRPIVFPVIGPFRYSQGYGVDTPYTRHTGVDIAAPKMSPIVAPFGGIIGFKRESFWIYDPNGWMLLGTHLNDDNLGKNDHKGNRDVMFAPNLVPGMTVHAGQFLGYVGDSGMATGPHLHFELYAPGSGQSQSRIRDAAASLRHAIRVAAPLPYIRQPNARPAKGYVRYQACIRGVYEASKSIKVILLGKQFSTGTAVVVTSPHYLYLTLAKKAITQLGGWKTLRSMASTRTLGLYLPVHPGPLGTKVEAALPSPTLR